MFNDKSDDNVAQMLIHLQADLDKIYEEEKVNKVYFSNEGTFIVDGKDTKYNDDSPMEHIQVAKRLIRTGLKIIDLFR